MRLCGLCLLLALLTAARSSVITPIKYQLLEEQRPRTFVGNLVKDAGLDSKYDSKTIDELTFALLSVPKNDASFLTVHEKDGVIRTAKEVDRDVVCPKAETCTLKYDIAVRPRRYFQIIKIVVTLLDINDNYPQFPARNIRREISESAAPGTSYPVPEAEDPDSGDYGIQGYKLLDESNKFDLQVTETADGGTDLRLVLRDQLDRESEDFYQVKIAAYDGGNPRKTSYMEVDISVTDANDHGPTFTNATYEVLVSENTQVGRSILRVLARDPDQGLNGDVIYKFTKATQHDFGHVFGIHAHTGDVVVRGKLDYEINSIYLLSVTAHDQGPDSLPAHASVVVRIVDENDNSPEIQVNTLTNSGEAEVAENSKLGTFVAHISVVDLDSGENGRFSCSLDSRKFNLQKLYRTEYKLVTASTFDREEKHRYRLNIKCRDMGQPAHLTSAKLKVNVVDQNDHRPHFLKDSYSVTIEENNDVNAFITQVSAIDEDAGPNGKLTYELAEDSRSSFSIDSESGVITALVRFDHEVIKELVFHANVHDNGDPRKSATCTVIVSIVDLNDEMPRFSTHSYEFNIYENEPRNSEVGRLIATDRDDPPYNQFSYSLDQSHHGVKDFSINSLTGVIQTRLQLNREAIATYFLVAKATALDDPRKEATASVTVYVGDRNDHSPVFIFPTRFNHTVHVSKESPLDHKFIRVNAVDHDSGKNGRLTYSIERGNKDNTFNIDHATGAISVARRLSKLQNHVFELEIKVNDRGDQQKVSYETLTIVVSDSMLFPYMGLSFLQGDNLYKVIGLGAAALLLIIFTVVAVLVLRRKQSQGHRKDDLELDCKERELMLDGLDKQQMPEQYTTLDITQRDCDSMSRNEKQNHQLLDIRRHQQCNGQPPEPLSSATAIHSSRPTSPAVRQDGRPVAPDFQQAHAPDMYASNADGALDGSDSGSSLSDSGKGPSGDEGDNKNSSTEHEPVLRPSDSNAALQRSKMERPAYQSTPKRQQFQPHLETEAAVVLLDDADVISPLVTRSRNAISPPAYHTLSPQHRLPPQRSGGENFTLPSRARCHGYQAYYKQEPCNDPNQPQHVTVDPRVHVLERPAGGRSTPTRCTTPTRNGVTSPQRPLTPTRSAAAAAGRNSILKSHRPKDHVLLKHSDIDYIDDSEAPVTDV